MIVQLLVCVTGQDVGRFEFSLDEFSMSYSVYEDHRVGFTFKMNDKPAFADGPYHLLKKLGSTYEVDLNNTFEGADYWYQNIDLSLPRKKFLKGDLTLLYYLTANAVSVNFRGRGILLTRVGFGINPGLYLYRSPDSPNLKVECVGNPTHYELFKFKSVDLPYLHYVVDSTALEKYLDAIKEHCPTTNLKKGVDLSWATFATGATLIIPVAGTPQVLQKL
ncbi:hypothetical protein FOZ60_005358 [Perkinsus olseni]|uniref:Uncharacterized protein n=1 Tax=Perkinsus olseni TaxID=32597 RepID=A0A7J6NRG0_PEROL|nr:hypothetical protein FOZ60_005358 [Perkinsus olseni]